jgi:aerobic carbon-monoxide dehydrogenase large subunit
LANVVGQRVRRREDPRFLRGEGRYVDDLPLEGALHATFVRSPIAHARIAGVDASAVTGAQVFAAGDVDLPPLPAPEFIGIDERMHQPCLATEKVRYVGDIVAVVLAETREASVDAAELVDVDYEELPVVTEPLEALKDEVLLFEDVGTNVCLHRPPEDPDPALLDGSEIVVRGTHVSQRIAACPIEPRASVAQPGEDGGLTMWLSTQTPHQDRHELASMLGLSTHDIRVIAPDVGGGFGGKGLAIEDVVLAWLARATGRTVKWTETRTENLLSMRHGRAQRAEFEVGASRDGRIEAMRVKLLQDAGAYPELGAYLATMTRLMSSGVYDIPRIEVDVTAVVTNTTPTGPVRGAGRPEAAQLVERAIDVLAAELSLDPAEVRRRNFIARDAFPFETATGAHYDCGDYERALELALQHADYRRLREEQAARRSDGTARQLGIGIATYVEVSNGVGETEFGAVEITPDGEAILKTGSMSQGQGHETTFAQIAAERLGLPVEKVTVVKGDTATVARGTGTYASKSTQIGGAAAAKASADLADRARRLAAAELEAAVDDLVLDAEAGTFHVAGAPRPSLTWSDLAARMQQQGRLHELSAEADFTAPQPTFPFGAHVAVVEVDTETGRVELKRMIAVDDAGRIINPLVAEGQVHGGLAAGIAQALHEEIAYDEYGNPQNANLTTYCFPGIMEMPMFELGSSETPTPANELGAKGIGESGTTGATPAVKAAVIDALAPFGVTDVEMPANGERVWRALTEARRRNP